MESRCQAPDDCLAPPRACLARTFCYPFFSSYRGLNLGAIWFPSRPLSQSTLVRRSYSFVTSSHYYSPYPFPWLQATSTFLSLIFHDRESRIITMSSLRYLLTLIVPLLLALACLTAAQDCSASNPCKDGCCNEFGFCGYGPDCKSSIPPTVALDGRPTENTKVVQSY